MNFFRNLFKSGYISRAGTLLAGTYVSLDNFQPLENSNSSPILLSFFQNQDLAGLLNALFKLSLSVGAILAVLQIAYAGYLYMGSDMWTKKEEATRRLKDAVLGLLLLLSIYTILFQINSDILNLNFLQDFTRIS